MNSDAGHNAVDRERIGNELEAQCNSPRLPPLTAADRHAAMGVLWQLPGNNSDEMLNAILDELWAAINAS